MAIYGTSLARDPATRRRSPGSAIEHRHRGLGGGGNLRAAVFGVNDGLVSNASLILGIAGASPDPHVVLLTGVAGMCAGAFAMAAGEYVSVRSQRELFEYQIGLERDELEEYPEAEAQELALDLRREGPAGEGGEAARRPASSPIRSTRSTRSRARSSGSIPRSSARRGARRSRRSCRSPPGRCCRSLRSCSRRGRARLPIAIGVTAVALFRVGALLSLFTGRNALYSGARMLVLGAPRRRRHLRDRPSGGRRSDWRDLLTRAASTRRCAEARPRQIAARAASVDLLGRDRPRRRRYRDSGDTVDVAQRRRHVPRPRRVFAGVADSRARVDVRSARSRSMRRSSRAASRARSRTGCRCCDARHTGCRLIHGEADGLPGLVVDRYGDTIVVQLSAAGAERWRDAIVARSSPRRGAACVYERSDAEVRALEGLRRARACARRTARRSDADRRRPRVPRRRRRRPEDRLLSRPARQPRDGARARRGPRRAQRVLLHGRLHAGGARRRRAPRAVDRQLRPTRSRWRRDNLARNPELDAARANGRKRDAFTELRKLRDAPRHST